MMSKDDRELIEQEYRKTATIRAVQWFKMGDHPAVKPIGEAIGGTNPGQGWVDTLEGGHIVTPGDWIATGIQGEHWPIKPDIFAATYELAVTRLEALQAQPVGEAGRLREAVENAIAGIEAGNLYEPICCGGGGQNPENYCGCRGSSNADLLIYHLRAALTASPPIVEREAIDVVDRARQIAQESYDAIRPTGGKFWGELDDMTQTLAIVAARDAILALTPVEGVGGSFQARVAGWMQQCFGPEIAADKLERNDRFIEESLELVQSLGYSQDRAHALVDYVFGRPIGDPSQEVGGVMVTLAALCEPSSIDMTDAAETELARILQPEIVAKIRAKQAAKPTGSALPISTPVAQGDEVRERLLEALTPHGETKAAYMGEFSWTEWLPDENGVEQGHERTVPWTTIKEIMAAIRDRASVEKLDEADALATLTKGARDAG